LIDLVCYNQKSESSPELIKQIYEDDTNYTKEFFRLGFTLNVFEILKYEG